MEVRLFTLGFQPTSVRIANKASAFSLVSASGI
jgi:hypothetical protein